MNDYLFLLICSVVTIACFYFIIAPFFVRRPEHSSVPERKNESISIESIYRAVNEIEMDYLMKKITKEDFQLMKERYQMLASDHLSSRKQQKAEKPSEEIDTAETDGFDQQIFAELKKIREKRGAGLDE